MRTIRAVILAFTLVLAACPPPVEQNGTGQHDTGFAGSPYPMATSVTVPHATQPSSTTAPTDGPADAPPAYSTPMAHLRCATRFDVTLPDGTIGGAYCAFGIMANGRDRTCLLDESTGTVVCL